MSLLFTIITLFVAACSQPIVLQDLASRIQISELSTPHQLASAALAWSLTETSSTERICDFAKNVVPAHAAVRALSLAQCENVDIDIPQNPGTPKELYDVVMTKPDSRHLASLLSMANGASHHEKLMLLHAGAFLLSANPDLKGTTDCKQLVSLFNQLIKSSSKDLLRFDDDLGSSVQKASHLGCSAYYLGSLGLIEPDPGALQRIAETIVSQTYTRSPENIAAIIELATCLSRYSKYTPVMGDVVENKDGILSLKVTDIFGRSVDVDSVTVKSCKSLSGKSLPLIEQSNSGEIHRFKFDVSPSNAGIYRPIMKIVSQGQQILYESPKLALTVFGSIEFSQFEARTSSKHEDKISYITASYPNESEDVLEITSRSTHLHVTFKLTSNLADVAYIGVALINMDTNKHVVLTPTKRASGNYQLKLKYSHSTFNSRVPGNGRYQIKLLVSDPGLPNYIEWNVCKANVTLARMPGAVRIASEFVHMPKSLIVPRLRDIPHKSNALYILFTALIVLAFFWLLFVWSKLHLNLELDRRPANILFHSFLLAYSLTLLSYWTGAINLAQLSRPLPVILVSLAVFYRILTKSRSLENHIVRSRAKTN